MLDMYRRMATASNDSPPPRDHIGDTRLVAILEDPEEEGGSPRQPFRRWWNQVALPYLRGLAKKLGEEAPTHKKH